MWTTSCRHISGAGDIIGSGNHVYFSVSRSVVADISKYHYIHHYLEITAVIRPATRLHIIVVFLLTDSHVMQLAQAEPRRHTARRVGDTWADISESDIHNDLL